MNRPTRTPLSAHPDAFKHFMTLNFERSIEEAHAAVELPCGTISCCDRSAISRFLATMDSPDQSRQIVHLHGVYSDPTLTIALTENGYRHLYHDSHLFKHVLWLLAAPKRRSGRMSGLWCRCRALNRVTASR
jgi:hypothetical protein